MQVTREFRNCGVKDKDSEEIQDSGETSYSFADTDGGGLSDFEERILLQGPVSGLTADTDGDGLWDGDEDSDRDLLTLNPEP